MISHSLINELLYISCRYDGLYSVEKVYDSTGSVTLISPTDGNEQYTFFLVRLPTKSESHCSGYWNQICTNDLCHKISEGRLEGCIIPRPKPNYIQLPKLLHVPIKCERKDPMPKRSHGKLIRKPIERSCEHAAVSYQSITSHTMQQSASNNSMPNIQQFGNSYYDQCQPACSLGYQDATLLDRSQYPDGGQSISNNSMLNNQQLGNSDYNLRQAACKIGFQDVALLDRSQNPDGGLLL